MKKESTKETLAFVKDIMENEKDLDSAPNTIGNPLRLRWDDITYQYKVGKSGDRSGLYVDLEIANRLKEENALLIESLENILNKITSYTPNVNTSNEKQVELYLEYHKTKELLNNLKKQ